jgi:hypothetical protein
MKGARGPLPFSVAECIVHAGTGAARSRVQPPAVRARLGHNASTKELPPAPEPAEAPDGGARHRGWSQGRPQSSTSKESMRMAWP